MYSFNLENIVPSGGLACLIAKATIDESNKWHRRLGHVNFKNLNKLVKGNLVRGLPSKIFQNDHTCVACQKGKQHKASCDSAIEVKSVQDYFVLPIWSSYTSTVKSSKANNVSEEPTKHLDLKPVDKEDQVYLEELKRQEQDANDAAEALRKEFAQETEDLLLQAGADKASNTNIVNTVSTPVSTVSPYGGLSFTDPTNTDLDDSEIPALKEIYDNLTDGRTAAIQDSKSLDSCADFCLLGKKAMVQNWVTRIKRMSEVFWLEIWQGLDQYMKFSVRTPSLPFPLDTLLDEEINCFGNSLAALGLYMVVLREIDNTQITSTPPSLPPIPPFKGMSYNEIRPIFEKVWDFNQHIEPMDMEHGSEKMKSPEKIEEEDVDTQKEMKEVVKESGAKRKKSLPRKRRTVKRQKLEEDAEKEELKGFLDIIPREDVAEDVESLSTKYPIVDWKTYTLTENFMYYQIFRGDGSSKNYKVLSEMLEDFDRQDVEELYRLVKERYSASRPEGYDLMLWGDLHTLFEPDEEDEIWKNQHEYNVISWSLYDFCGIHILLMQNGIAIHMLTEKKYPLSQETITKMLNKRLEVDHESSQAFELLRFIRSQVQK
ncbi:putative reverse transcriptase domain-containing protein [Tanacetum coccineum]